MIPDYQCERLERSPLAAVIAQVRYSPFPTLDRTRFAPFIDGVSSDYPFFSEDKTSAVVIDPSGAMRVQDGETLYRFTSADQLWSVSIGLTSMTLECRGQAYEGIEDFQRRFSRVAHLLQQLGPKKQLRFGFRFVNEIRLEGGDEYQFWYEALNHDVLGYNAEHQFDGKVETTVSEVVVQRNDGTVRLRRGFLSGTTVAPLPTPHPMPIAHGPFYMIDIDYYDERVADYDPDFGGRLRAYNAYLFRVFHWIVGEGTLWQYLRGDEARSHG